VTGLDLPVTLAFDHPTSAALTEHVLEELMPEAPEALEADTGAEGEAQVRALLNTVPIQRLRDSGVLDSLLRLADGYPEDQPEDGESIDSMDLDDLVQAALNGQSDDSTRD
jgi:hypothetical protein